MEVNPLFFMLAKASFTGTEEQALCWTQALGRSQIFDGYDTHIDIKNSLINLSRN